MIRGGKRGRCAYALSGVLLLAACDKNPVVPPDDGGFVPRTSITLPSLGHGDVPNRYTAEVAARDQWVYTTSWQFRPAPGNAVMIWDGSGNTPVLVDSLIVANVSTLGDVEISDDGKLLVVATEYSGGSIMIYDRTDPAHPTLITQYTSPNTTRGVHTAKVARVDGRLYAFLCIDPSPAQLVIVDITDPASPREVFVQAMGAPYVHDVFVRDGLLFTALWNDGMTIWDIGGGGKGGTPANPIAIGNVKTLNGHVHNIFWYHSPAGEKKYAFIGEENSPFSLGVTSAGDIHVVDVSDMANPHEVAFYHVPNAGTHNFSVDEAHEILYAAYYNGGVRALDIRGDLSQCDASTRAADGRCDLAAAKREAGAALTGQTICVWGVSRVGRYISRRTC